MKTYTFILPSFYKRALLDNDWDEYNWEETKAITNFLKKNNLGKCLKIETESDTISAESALADVLPGYRYCAKFTFQENITKESLLAKTEKWIRECSSEKERFNHIGYFQGYCKAMDWKCTPDDVVHLVEIELTRNTL